MKLHLAKEMISLEARIRTAKDLLVYFDPNSHRDHPITHDPVQIGRLVDPEVHEIFGGRQEMRDFIRIKLLQSIQEYIKVQEDRYQELENA